MAEKKEHPTASYQAVSLGLDCKSDRALSFISIDGAPFLSSSTL